MHPDVFGRRATGVVTNPGSGSPNLLLYTLGARRRRLRRCLLTPPPPPGCGGLTETFSGSLTGARDADLLPGRTGFTTGAGTLQGCLDGPSGADFDLALFRLNGSRWTRVAVSRSASPDESITYNASGDYSFAMQRP